MEGVRVRVAAAGASVHEVEDKRPRRVSSDAVPVGRLPEKMFRLTTLMVPEKHLTRVAGMNQTLYGALNIVGPALGALAMALMPLSAVMMVDVSRAFLLMNG